MPEPRAVSAVAEPQHLDITLHVDGRNERASDDNSGTTEAPLRTIGEAVRRAVLNKQRFRSTLIAVRPGMYREAINLATYTNYTGKPENTTPIVVEATEPGTAIVSGSDLWEDWRFDEATDLFVHSWPYSWGVTPDPTRGTQDLREIVLRRELIFMNGEPLRQVLSPASMENGTFYVDEAGRQLVLKPPAGMHPAQVGVEVGVREVLWHQEWEDHVMIRGLVFQHAATRWEDSWAAVRISSCKQTLIEDVAVQWNNGAGVYVGQSEALTMSRVYMDHNGWDGLRLWRIRDAVIEDGTTNENNRRGHQGGYHTWSVGNKIHNVHGLVLRRHTARGNYSRGLWLDEDNRDVILEQVDISENLSDGLFLEANPGPVQIVSSRLENNGAYGLSAANTMQVHVEESRIAENEDGGLEITGNGEGRDVRDYVSGATYRLFAENWTLERNELVGRRSDHPLLHTTLGTGAWERFARSLISDRNTWRHPDLDSIFSLPLFSIGRFELNRSYGPSAWQRMTGSDRNSTFEEIEPVQREQHSSGESATRMTQGARGR